MMAEKHETAQVDAGIVEMWRKDGRLYAIGGFLIGLMVFPLLAALDGGRIAGFLQELAPEAVGILVTVVLIDRLAERRADRKAEEALKQRLKDDAASYVNDVASNAVYQMQRKGWLEGSNGLLQEADLSKANLQGADLSRANLQGADLRDTKLQGGGLTRGEATRGKVGWGEATRGKIGRGEATRGRLESSRAT